MNYWWGKIFPALGMGYFPTCGDVNSRLSTFIGKTPETPGIGRLKKALPHVCAPLPPYCNHLLSSRRLNSDLLRPFVNSDQHILLHWRLSVDSAMWASTQIVSGLQRFFLYRRVFGWYAKISSFFNIVHDCFSYSKQFYVFTVKVQWQVKSVANLEFSCSGVLVMEELTSFAPFKVYR